MKKTRSNIINNSLSKTPTSINADEMTEAELRAALMAGYEDARAGRTRDANEVFAQFRAAIKE